MGAAGLAGSSSSAKNTHIIAWWTICYFTTALPIFNAKWCDMSSYLPWRRILASHPPISKYWQQCKKHWKKCYINNIPLPFPWTVLHQTEFLTTVKNKWSIAINLHLYWIHDCSHHGHFGFFGEGGTQNIANYLIKHHLDHHHRATNPAYFHNCPFYIKTVQKSKHLHLWERDKTIGVPYSKVTHNSELRCGIPDSKVTQNPKSHNTIPWLKYHLARK